MLNSDDYPYPDYYPDWPPNQQSRFPLSSIPMFNRNDLSNKSFYKSTYQKSFNKTMEPRNDNPYDKNYMKRLMERDRDILIDESKIYHKKKDNLGNLGKYDNYGNYLDLNRNFRKDFRRKDLFNPDKLNNVPVPRQITRTPISETKASFNSMAYPDQYKKPNSPLVSPKAIDSYLKDTDLNNTYLSPQVHEKPSPSEARNSSLYLTKDLFLQNPVAPPLKMSLSKSPILDAYRQPPENDLNPIQDYKAILDNFYRDVSNEAVVNGGFASTNKNSTYPIIQSPQKPIYDLDLYAKNNDININTNLMLGPATTMKQNRHKKSIHFLKTATGSYGFVPDSDPNPPVRIPIHRPANGIDPNPYRANYYRTKLHNPDNLNKRNSSNQIIYNFIDEPV